MNDYSTNEVQFVTSLGICDKSGRNKNCNAEITIYADVAIVNIPRQSLPGDEQRQANARRAVGSRKAITRLTQKSVNNFYSRSAKMRNIRDGYFLTCTFPDEWEWSKEKDDAVRIAFRHRLLRKYPQSGGWWFIEFKPRKSGKWESQIYPHYHLAVYGIGDDITEVAQWASKAWWDICGQLSEDHRKHGCDVEKISHPRRAVRYVTKYVTKAAEEPVTEPDENSNNILTPPAHGRYWGFFGLVDDRAILRVKVAYRQFIDFRRLVVRWLKSKKRGYARTLARMSDEVGFMALGLGDMSIECWSDLFDCTVLRMLLAS